MTAPESRPDRFGPPPRWPMLVAIGTLLMGVVANVASNLLSEIAGDALGPASAAVAAAGAVASVLFEVRRRRAARYSSGDPTDTVPPAGAPTLPYTAGFTGRAEHVARIVDDIKREHAVAVVGRRAVGTSSCAVQAANLCRSAYPDGQPYLDLRRGGRPWKPRQVLTELARILGTPPPRSGRPADLTAAADAIRGHLDGKEILLVLDNVDDPDQARALLPPAARTCRLLLAGTPRLSGLEGLVTHWLDEPGPDEAVELFASAGGVATGTRSRRPDPRTDPAVRMLVELCGRQPRTVRALGYRSARHGWNATDVLRRLRAAIEAPPHERMANSPALTLLTERDTAYGALSGEARRLYRLLSLAPVTLSPVEPGQPAGAGSPTHRLTTAAVDRTAIAALARRRPERVAAVLDELGTAGFVIGTSGDRFQVQPLLGPYARLHLRDAVPRWRRVLGQVRLIRHLTRRAERHLTRLTGPGSPTDRERSLPLDDDPAAWFDLHHELLRDVVLEAARATQPLPRRLRRWWFRLATALCGWYAHEGRSADWELVCRMVLRAPTAEDRREIAGWTHNELGVLLRRRNEPHAAVEMLNLAVAKRGRRGAAQAQLNLALALLDLGNVDEAIEHLELSRRHRAGADRTGHALTDLGLGAAHLARDEPRTANRHLVRAANAFSAIGDARGFAAALSNLALVHSRLGEHLDAAQAWRAALREYESLDDGRGRATVLLNAGVSLLASTPPRAGAAYDRLTESLLLRDGSPITAGHGRTLLHLGDAAEILGRHDEARRHWAGAERACEAVRDAEGMAAAGARLAGR
ncbi:hypothetical protein [Plantactinospora sp. GCM10030261]|uniref:hypothetical protein n=1 Tax=Plantactinospora sp. GCM10030261 TaxID=3273420 RepID=UPI0036166513